MGTSFEPGVGIVKLSSKELLTRFRALLNCAVKEGNGPRHYTNTVCFDFSLDDGINLVATDGYMMTVHSLPKPGGDYGGKALIAYRDIATLLRLVRHTGDGEITLTFNADGCLVDVETVRLSASLRFKQVDTLYPKYAPLLAGAEQSRGIEPAMRINSSLLSCSFPGREVELYCTASPVVNEGNGSLPPVMIKGHDKSIVSLLMQWRPE